jgi:hypothetical protein
VQLVPAVQYVTEHSRRIQTTREAAQESGVEWSSSWSLHPEEVMALVIPEFAGNNSRGADWSQGTYWGRNATRDNHSGAGVVVLLLGNVVLLWAYTASCHSCRHITGGRLRHFSKHPVRYKLWTWVSKENARHSMWAWWSLFSVAAVDFYVYLLSTGTITDPRFF